MTKKILLLVLFLPMILMISLFSTTDAVSLAIDIPVTGIEIVEDNIVYLDLDQNEKYEINYTVYPTNATNQKVSLSTEQVGEERLAKVEFVDGYLIPKSIGVAKVFLTTIDGSFKDSFIVQVDSNMLQEIESEISENKIYVGGTAVITTTFIPANATNQIIAYRSSNENVAKVDANGNVLGVGRGQATITIYSVDNENVYDTVEINVYNTDIMDIGETNIITWNQSGEFNLSIDSDADYQLSYQVLDYALNVTETDNIILLFGEETENGNVKVTYTFKEEYIGQYTINIIIKTTLGYELTKSISIEKVDKVTAEFLYDKTPSVVQGTTSMLAFAINPSDANVKYSVEVSNNNVQVNVINGLIILNALLPGVTNITVKAFVEGIEEPAVDSIDVVILPKAFTINELSKTYGIEGTWTVGKEEADGSQTTNKLTISYGKDVGENFLENIYWVAVDKDGNNIDAISIDKNGNFKIIDSSFTGDVYFKCIYEYDGCKKESSSLLVKCIGEGVNVGCYEDLLNVTKAGKVVVLKNNISDFGLYKNGTQMDLSKTYVEIPTTYDWTYYRNLGKEHPTVKVLIQFKNDVYGNGYTINAHNITTYAEDSTGAIDLSKAIFAGPLNFVAVTDSNSSSISVKAQDNICFALYENVTINNVELKGRDLKAEANGSYDLKDLDYAGTVVEVLGDNVDIKYSRVTNGRTGIRIFGDINDSNKVINVNISNSILSGAREFILRVGSNAFIDGGNDINDCSPYLPNNTVTSFPVYPSYYKLSKAKKDSYDNAFIKTFVTIKNSTFKDCGIFSIAMDSHFSGALLANGSSDEVYAGRFKDILGETWYDLAKTSYGAKVTFDGDVRIYDWKDLTSVDSSTLISLVKGNALFDRMELKVQEMVAKISENPKYKNIVYTDPTYKNGATYVHGGIAFFGGGKNYCVFEEINIEDSFAQLNGYEITLGDCGRAELTAAAGDEPFYFLMHDATNTTFTPKHQDEYLASSDAYSNVYKK